MTISTPLPAMTARPCRSASLATRTGLPSATSRARASSKPCHRSLPRFGAVSTLPSRTTPGKPTDTRSNGPSGATMLASSSTIRGGGAPTGVGKRTRSVSIWAASSTTEAFSPVPPMSIAKVRRRAVCSIPARCTSVIAPPPSLLRGDDRCTDEGLAAQRRQLLARVEMLLDRFERISGGFRDPQQREGDAAEANHREHREGEGKAGAGQHQREGEDHHEVEAPVADRRRAHARAAHPQREDL